jgi:hypothetical protein
MVGDKALERWKTNCEVTPQAIWPIAKSLPKRVEPKASSAIHGALIQTIKYIIYNIVTVKTTLYLPHETKFISFTTCFGPDGHQVIYKH